jgi:hypothetical protein
MPTAVFDLGGVVVVWDPVPAVAANPVPTMAT